MPQSLVGDSNAMMKNDGRLIEMVLDNEHDTAVPIKLMNVGHHYDDVPKGILKAHYSTIQLVELPWSAIHDFVADGHLETPLFRKQNSME